MKSAKILAYAKINLMLDVLRKREDGYHEVDMIMQNIDLADEIFLQPASEIKIKCTETSIPEKDNLAYKAADLLRTNYPEILGAEIIINKKIPLQAGLAGGSADAAAVLRGLPLIYGLKPEQDQLLEMAASLGSDVPFCLQGPTSRAKGRGEMLESLPEPPTLHLVLVKPFFGVSTAAVYQNCKLTKQMVHPDIEEYLRFLDRGDLESLINKQRNVLEESTFELFPEIVGLKNEMLKLGAKQVTMSGSGPTLFASFKEEKNAAEYFARIKTKDAQVFLTKTVSEKTLEKRVMIFEKSQKITAG